MAMPRPSGKALKIAEQVVPGLSAKKKSSNKSDKKSRGSFSEVETLQTKQIEQR